MPISTLTTEQPNPRSRNFDQLSSLGMVHLINQEDQSVIDAITLEAKHISHAIDLIVSQMRKGGRLVYIGAGTSGRIGVLDASECPPTFGLRNGLVIGIIAGGDDALRHSVEAAEDDEAAGPADLKAINLNSTDVLVGLAASGRTPYVLAALRYARQIGAATIGVSCTSESKFKQEADVCVTPVVGPEVLTGSTRMKAGSAQKMVLNMFSTCAMARLGKVYGHWMVDMRATNHKLIERSKNIVTLLTGVTAETARITLLECNGNVKLALLTLMSGLSQHDARTRLEAVGGNVRLALEQVNRDQ